MTEIKRDEADAPSWGGAPSAAQTVGSSSVGSSASAGNASASTSGGSRLAPARISLVYESRDKRLCLFEDAAGHLTAVRASRLA